MDTLETYQHCTANHVNVTPNVIIIKCDLALNRVSKTRTSAIFWQT